MANHSNNIPFPRTPYPFEQPSADEFAGLASISDWLQLPEESEEYYPESNALTPEDWIACDGQEDPTWVVGELEWLEEGTKNADIVPGRLLGTESIASSAESTVSLSDLSSPQDTTGDQEQSHDQTAEYTLPPGSPDRPESFCPPPTRGVIRRRDSAEELQLPERKRPRLERCKRLDPTTMMSD